MTQRQETTKIGWQFDNSYTRLPESFFSKMNVNPVRAPELIIVNEELAGSLGLDPEALQSEEGIAVLAGNEVPEGGEPIAQAYAGHQFGNFTMLGDGRAILLGEQITSTGDRMDIQLKGAGRTPYSRGGDGRAALGPMLREYIISEAMHALGIPTTRSLAVVYTGETIQRESARPGAILTRVASSHLRVGTFQYARGRDDIENLRVLADYAIDRHYPELKDKDEKYLELFRAVMKRQAALIAKWQLVGFIHGVMNTDNMAISGETIDYGPCAFMDAYDPATVFSSIDVQGRYAYGNQPMIGGWNLARFAETLLPLLGDDQDKAIARIQEELSTYIKLYETNWLEGMRAKLGLFTKEAEDEVLADDLLAIMQDQGADFTNTFRALTYEEADKPDIFGTTAFKEWQARWHDRLKRQEESEEAVSELMRNSNPAVIPRNHKVEEALAAAVEQGDFGPLDKLLTVLEDPYNRTPKQADYIAPAPTDKPYQTYCGT
ncbi:protein adenylyltransferase SelO [Planococcus lenghuensis]|uniref:Protein nucleotidyltransferase YdiU n=1 Tax=Planococcus lenghuensis TaxID=2213202 RepID=A0A1Q2KWY3_9BACL|nr:YdiU family protein [Planococcus lenghuensis]AQQ52327.1 hypothetical protein B0X71_03850 [Planococcus lenghuensis]